MGHAERVDDDVIVAGDQREGEVIFFLEGFLRCDAVVAHADDGDALLCEGFVRIAERAALFGAAGGVGFRIEVQNHILPAQRLRRHRLLILVEQRELRYLCSFF